MKTPRSSTTRRMIAVVGAAAALAVPATALAHDHGGNRGERPNVGAQAGERPEGARGNPMRAVHRGPSASHLAAELGLERSTVRTAMRSAKGEVRDITDKAARATAFKAALATNLGVDVATIEAAFDAIKADKLTRIVTRLEARGVLSAEQADGIEAQIAAGDLDAARAAIKAARPARS